MGWGTGSVAYARHWWVLLHMEAGTEVGVEDAARGRGEADGVDMELMEWEVRVARSM